MSTARLDKFACAGQILRRVNAERNAGYDCDVNAHAGLERPQLLQFFAQFQWRGGQGDEMLQGNPSIGI